MSGVLYCAAISRAFCYISRGNRRRFCSSRKWTLTHWVLTLQSKVSTESCRDIMNSPISNIKEKRNAFAELLNARLQAFTRHPIAIWLNQMLWVTNMASQRRAAQRALSCLRQKIAPLGRQCGSCVENVVYLIRRCRARLWCDSMLWTYATATGRDASVAREYFCKEEMIRISQDDVVPLPNMWWNATGMKRHSRGTTAGCFRTMVYLQKL